MDRDAETGDDGDGDVGHLGSPYSYLNERLRICMFTESLMLS